MIISCCHFNKGYLNHLSPLKWPWKLFISNPPPPPPPLPGGYRVKTQWHTIDWYQTNHNKTRREPCLLSALVLRQKRDKLGSHLETGVYSAESDLSISMSGKQFAQQRITIESGCKLTCHLDLVSYTWTFALSWLWKLQESEVIRRKSLYGGFSMRFSALYGRVSDSVPLQWRNDERCGVSNHQPHDCLLKRLFRCRSKKASKLCVAHTYTFCYSVYSELF